MSENLPNIDDLFRKALDEYEETPTNNVWTNIDKNLDKKKVVFISEKYRKLKWVAAALLLFSAGMAMYTLQTRLRNRELVKENELKRKKFFKKETGYPGIEKKYDTAMASKEGKNVEKSFDEPGEAVGIKNKKTADITKGEKKTFDVNQVETQPLKISSKKATEETIANNTRNRKSTLNNIRNQSQPIKNNALQAAVTQSALRQLAVNEATKLEVEKSTEPTTLDEPKRMDATTAKLNERDLVYRTAPDLSARENRLPGLNNSINSTPQGTATKLKNSVKLTNPPRFSNTVFFSPDIVSTRVDNGRRDYREDDKNEIKNKEKTTNSTTKGILINYRIAKKLNLQTGVSFSTMTTDIQPKTIFARPDDRGNINYRLNCSAGYSYVSLKSGVAPNAGDSVTALSSRNTLQYVAVPIALTYNLIFKKFVLQPGVGLAANFLTKGKIETEIASQTGNEKTGSNQIVGLNSSYINSSISLAANYYFTRSLALSLTPVTKIALSAINKDAPVKTYLNSFSLAAGLTFRF